MSSEHTLHATTAFMIVITDIYNFIRADNDNYKALIYTQFNCYFAEDFKSHFHIVTRLFKNAYFAILLKVVIQSWLFL